MEYHCPLCGQPVSLTLYKQITGIWKERQRLLAKIKEQRAKLTERAAEFRKQRTQLIQQAVQKRTKPLETKINALKQREERLETEARLRIQEATAQIEKSEGAMRQRLLTRMKKQEAAFARKIKSEKARFRREEIRLEKHRGRLVQQAVRKQTGQLEAQIKTLRLKEARIEKAAQRRIERATALAHHRAEKLAAARMSSLKKTLRASLRDQLSKQKDLMKNEVKEAQQKYRGLNRTFLRTLARTRVKDRELREQAERFRTLSKQLRLSFKNKFKEERKRGAQQIRRRYDRLERTFRSTLSQMTIKDRELRIQAQQIKELRRELERQTTPQMEGLLYEDNLIRELRRRFPKDIFQHTGKGGDIVQNIMRRGEQVGIMVYECKRVKHYLPSHVKQASEAKEKRKADFAILVTNAMKKGTQGFFTERGVMVVHVAGVLSLATILRDQIIRIAQLKLGQLQRRKAVKLVLEYLEGPDFANSLDSIVQETITLYNDLKEEVRKHVISWKKRYDSYRKVHEQALAVKSTSNALLSGEPRRESLQGEQLPALPEMPEVEKDKPEVSP